MPPRTGDTADSGSTVWPGTDSFDRYSYVQTDDAYIIYDADEESAWVQAQETLDLDEWR